MNFSKLREALQRRLFGESKRLADKLERMVLTLLAGPGMVWELAFGSRVLLQPEQINAYAQAVIQTLQADEHQHGCLMEERVLKGDLAYESSMARLAGDEERFVLLAMHQTLVERGFPSPSGRKTIAQRFIAGFPGAEGTSPVRDERAWRGPCSVISFAPAGLGRFDGCCPSDESLGYFRSSLTRLFTGEHRQGTGSRRQGERLGLPLNRLA